MSFDEKKESNELLSKKNVIQYELLPPEGGWGYAIAGALTIMMIATLIPMVGFGLIFGKFLASVGDETTGTALANGIFNTVLSFTGLASNYFLQKYTYRKVGVMGAILFFLGAFSTIFVTSTMQLVVSFGIIQGLGFGMMMPASYTALNCYFDKKMSVIMGISQAIMVGGNMTFPSVARALVDFYGFRGTVAILAAFSLNCIPAMAALQPVQWHMKRKPVNRLLSNLITENLKEQNFPLLDKDKDEEKLVKYIAPKPRGSIISIGERAMSVSTLNNVGLHNETTDEEELSGWKKLVKTMDLRLLKDAIYLNIACGLSLSFTADVVFISLMPLVLSNFGYTHSDVAFAMTVHFGSDLISRVLLSLLVAFVQIKNRTLFLIGSILSCLFRIGFVLSSTYFWQLGMISCLGAVRSMIQTPLPLVISENYSSNFAAAFSLYMVVCGCFSLVFGPLTSFVKSYTGDNVMVLHVLTMAYLITSITWTIELIWTKTKSSARTKENHEVVKIND